jgi:hypothetical protein
VEINLLNALLRPDCSGKYAVIPEKHGIGQKTGAPRGA